MQEDSATDLPWTLILKALDSLEGSRVHTWIPQPEIGTAFLEVVKALGSPKPEIFHTFRPTVEELKGRRLPAVQTQPTTDLDLVLCVPTRQRTESLAFMAQGLLKLKPEGALVFACANDQGAGGFLSRLKEVAPTLESDSAKKCRWAILRADQIKDRAVLETWIREAAAVTVPGTSFRSVPGIYGWNKVDRGSELLMSTVPELTGSGADLGCGYGYLAHTALTRPNSISRMVLVEAEFRALECARQNLAPWQERCAFHWLDVTSKDGRSVAKSLDWVLMNPPFHEGSESNHDMGRAFIESAAQMLAPGGRLYLVANAFLGYEKALSSHFHKVDRVLEKDGFKVIHAGR